MSAGDVGVAIGQATPPELHPAIQGAILGASTTTEYWLPFLVLALVAVVVGLGLAAAEASR